MWCFRGAEAEHAVPVQFNNNKAVKHFLMQKSKTCQHLTLDLKITRPEYMKMSCIN